MGLPPVLIHFSMDFPYETHPQLRGHSAAVLSLAFRAQAGCENRRSHGNVPWKMELSIGDL